MSLLKQAQENQQPSINMLLKPSRFIKLEKCYIKRSTLPMAYLLQNATN